MNEMIRVASRLEQTGELGYDCWLQFIDRGSVVVGDHSYPVSTEITKSLTLVYFVLFDRGSHNSFSYTGPLENLYNELRKVKKQAPEEVHSLERLNQLRTRRNHDLLVGFTWGVSDA